MLQKGWGRTHHRARMFQTLLVSLVQTDDSEQIPSSLFLHLWSNESPKSDVMLFTAIPLEEQGLLRDAHPHLSLYNHFFGSSFTSSIRSKADLITSKTKGSLFYLYRENTPSLPIFSSTRHECCNTWCSRTKQHVFCCQSKISIPYFIETVP